MKKLLNIEDQIVSVAIADIDIEALALKFKPLIKKNLEEYIKDAISNYDWYELLERSKFWDKMEKELTEKFKGIQF